MDETVAVVRLNVGKVVWVLRMCCLPEGENIRVPEKTVKLSAVRLA